MSRGVDRQAIFFTDDDRIDFGGLLREVHQRFGIEIHAYCLMGNHFHLLVRCPEAGLSESMHHLLSVFAKRVNDRTGRVGHLFAGRFTSRLVTTERYIATAVRYIHRNPLDIVGIDAPSSYRWSSHRSYVGARPRPPWLSTEVVLQWFDNELAFDQFVRGSSPDLRCLPLVPSVDPSALLAAIDLLLAEQRSGQRRHARAQRRAVALLLARRLSCGDRSSLLDALGLQEGSSGLRVALHRTRRLRDDEPVIAEVAERVALLFELSANGDVAA